MRVATSFRKLTIAAMLMMLFTLSPDAFGQLVIGAGPTYAMPQGKFLDVNKNSIGGTLALHTRRFCHWWFGLRIDYTPFKAKDTLSLFYADAVLFSGEARYFFSPPTELPIYLQADITMSGINGRDSLSPSGLGVAFGAGALLFYDKDCCDWFIDINARYQTPNRFLRSEIRPELPFLHFNASIYFKL